MATNHSAYSSPEALRAIAELAGAGLPGRGPWNALGAAQVFAYAPSWRRCGHEPTGWAAFAAMSVIWGVPYLFIKVAVDDGRLAAFLSFARSRWPPRCCWRSAGGRARSSSLRGRWRWVAAYAVAEIALPFPLIAAGEQRVSSSLAAILIACVPLLVARAGDPLRPAERPRASGCVGLLTGSRRRRAGRRRRRGRRRRADRHRADRARRLRATRSGR